MTTAPPFETADHWFRSPRRGVYGWGEALVVDVPAPWPEHLAVVTAALASCGADAVAIGALPFDRGAAATFTVPALTVTATADGERRTVELGGVEIVPVDHGGPGAVTVTSLVDPACWCHTVARATQLIRDGRLTKVVLAREIEVRTGRQLDPRHVGAGLAGGAPGALAFGTRGFVGASPELLVSRVGETVRAHPMAGTLPRTGDPELDLQRAAELLASAKNRVEHQITIDTVLDALLPWCSYVDSEPEPRVVAAGPVQHLASLVEGRLSDPPPSVLELIAALHPTPAVGGWPRAAALDVIAELEPGDRGRYAGPVGWVDAEGNGAFAVGIRAASLEDRVARLWAGVGVVADSDPDAELEETRAKFRATLAAFTSV